MCSTSFAGANRTGSRVCGIALSAPLFGSLGLIRGAPLSYDRYLSKDSALAHRIGWLGADPHEEAVILYPRPLVVGF